MSASTLVIPPFLAYDQGMTRPALILVAALALTGCADVAANIALNVAGPFLIEPAIQLVAVEFQLELAAFCSRYCYDLLN